MLIQDVSNESHVLSRVGELRDVTCPWDQPPAGANTWMRSGRRQSPPVRSPHVPTDHLRLRPVRAEDEAAVQAAHETMAAEGFEDIVENESGTQTRRYWI